MSSYSEGQIHQLADRLEAEGFTPDDITKLGQYKNLSEIRGLLRGTHEVNLLKQEEVRVEKAVDAVIRIDRMARPAYPSWTKKVMHPELEGAGPAEYEISVVKQWFHEEQKKISDEGVEGNKIYRYLVKNNLLNSHLGVADLRAIKDKGVAFFRKYFSGMQVFAWKSVILDYDGDYFVPCLEERDKKMIIQWFELDLGWHTRRPALYFAS